MSADDSPGPILSAVADADTNVLPCPHRLCPDGYQREDDQPASSSFIHG
jgi:hypothetical protein